MTARYRQWERVVFPPVIYRPATACFVRTPGGDYAPGELSTMRTAARTFCGELVGSSLGPVRACHDGRPTCPACRDAMRLDHLLGAGDG